MVVSVEKLHELLYLHDGVLYWHPRGIKNWDTVNANKPALTTNRHGYKGGTILGKKFLAHRVIWALSYGYWPDQLDHINRDRSDNRLENLRECSQQENMTNRTPSLGKTSRYTGVSLHKHSKKWRASITKNGRTYCLGYFLNEDEAAEAYNKSAETLFGPYAYLNRI